MNLYFLVEGDRTEKVVYRAWLSCLFDGVRFVDRPEDVSENCIRLISGGGYPQYLARIEEVLAEIEDIAVNRVGHLFVCIDSEEQSLDYRLAEVENRVKVRNPVVRYTVIVQDCCIESWFLGNRRFVKSNPRRKQLRDFRAFHDVREHDPERMGAKPPFEIRAKFHEEYLKEVYRERGLAYNKKRPREAGECHYLSELVKRYQETGHLRSFGRFVEVCRNLGSDLLDGVEAPTVR